MDFAEELRASLQDFFASKTIEIRETGGRARPEPPVSWEVRGAGTKPLLHVWAENCNITRRVLSITSQSEDCITLAVERFGRSRPERMELVRLDFQRSAKQISREGFCGAMRRILAEQLPDELLRRCR